LSPLFNRADIAPTYPAFAGQQNLSDDSEFGGELRPDDVKMGRVVIISENHDIE
jgi:hypothetical protein